MSEPWKVANIALLPKKRQVLTLAKDYKIEIYIELYFER